MNKEQFLTTKAVVNLTTLSRATIDRKVDAADFPKPIYLSARRKVFKESAVRQWMADREVLQ